MTFISQRVPRDDYQTICDLVEACESAIALLEGYIDTKDAPDGTPIANDAMRAVQTLQEAVMRANRVPSRRP